MTERKTRSVVGQPDPFGEERWPTPPAVPFEVAEVLAVRSPTMRRHRSVTLRTISLVTCAVVAQSVFLERGAARSPAVDALAALLVAAFAALWVAWRARKSSRAESPPLAFLAAFLLTFLVQRAGAWFLQAP